MTDDQHNALPKDFEFEGYRIQSILGAGGFGITYLADEIAIERKVAIKEFMPAGIAMRNDDGISVHAISTVDADDFDWGLDRFRKEAATLVSFRHPNIVRVHRYFEHHNTAYMVMEYEDGHSFSGILQTHGTLDESELKEVLLPLLEGLSEVHKKGFLHRDIKPGNIYVRNDGTPVLLDFGAARQALGEKSKSLTSIVTEGYAPPEQYESGGNQGPWTDIYAMGAVLYRAITGQKPVEAPKRMNAVARQEADPLKTVVESVGSQKYSGSFVRFIDESLQLLEADRPKSIEAWRKILSVDPEPALAPGETLTPKAVAPVPISAQRPDVATYPETEPTPRPARRSVWGGPWPGWAAAGVLLIAVAAVAASNLVPLGDNQQSKISALTTEVADLRAQQKALNDQRNEANGALSRERARNAAADQEKKDLAAKLLMERGTREKVEGEKRDLTKKLADETSRREKLQADNRELQSKLEAARTNRPDPTPTPTPTPTAKTPAALYAQGRAEMARRDYRRAFQSFNAAARNGYAAAQYQVGSMYHRGRGVPRSYSNALNWFRRAAGQGYGRAMSSLGAMYNRGEGVPRNYGTGLSWSRRAAAKGDALGMASVGWAYEFGRGVPRSIPSARYWYGQAASKGNRYARSRLNRLRGSTSGTY